MGLLAGLGDLLKQYSGSGSTPPNVEQHFDQVAQAVPSSSLAGGLADAFRSGQYADNAAVHGRAGCAGTIYRQ
jgi:TctA family transporter